jgi:PAS domain S-box-containing protein
MIRNAGDEAAAAERAVLASIVESSHDAIVAMTGDGVVRSWNPAAERLYGYGAAEIVGRSAAVLVAPKLRAEEAAMLRRIAAGEEVERYRTERVCRDGTVVAVSSTMSPIVGDGGVIVGAASTSRRLNELQEARDRFEVRMAKLRAEAADAAGRFEVQADAVRDQATRAQERFEVGVERERAQIRDTEDQFQTPMAEQGAESLSRRLSGELRDSHHRFEARVAEQRAEAHDAADRFETQVIESHDQAQHAHERFEGLVEFERVEAQHAADRYQVRTEDEEDKARSDKEDLEAQLQRGQRLELLGQLAGGVAHDFNNLLAVILNYAAFVAEDLAAAPASESMASAGRDVGQIERAAQRATALTHQLLAFARREVIHPRPLDLNHVVTDVTELLNRTIGEDVVLHIDLAADLWPVLADIGQMEQILVNLAVNARDAMSTGGTLSIDTAKVDVDGSRLHEGRYVQLRVADTGTGMTADIIKHVFEPFYTTKRDGTGTGLGLSTVYNIVTKADGTVNIDSQPGAGTTFTITLPATDEVAVPVTETPLYQHVPTGETVLIVEDEEALRQVTERIFTRHGYQAITAANGDDALALAAGYHGDIHLLVTDVVMPKMPGKEVADRIRRFRPDIKVLYISGYARPVLATKGHLDPDVHLIEKPFSAAAIIEKAGQILR